MKQENKNLTWKIGYILGTVIAYLACAAVIVLLAKFIAMLIAA
jgi:hypothetical protein